MEVGVIGSSKLRESKLVSKIAGGIAKLGAEIVLTANKGSASEFFSKKHLKFRWKKFYSGGLIISQGLHGELGGV